MSTTKQPQNLGFEDAFDQVKPDQWTVPEKSISNDHEVDTTDLQTGCRSNRFCVPADPNAKRANRPDQLPRQSQHARRLSCALRNAGTKLALWIWSGTGSCSPKTRAATRPCPQHEAVGCRPYLQGLSVESMSRTTRPKSSCVSACVTSSRFTAINSIRFSSLTSGR